MSVTERLHLPFAYAVTMVELEQSSGAIKVTKEMGGGTRQVLEMQLPALLCIQSGILPLGYIPVRRHSWGHAVSP
ncbi:hypothetical protein ACFLVH_00475 [Chloroflexota bacterium]